MNCIIINPQVDCFIDTNILVYAFDRSAGQKHAVAAQLLEDLWANETGNISIQVLQEFIVIVTHKVAPPLDQHTARQIIADLAHWRVHSPNVTHIFGALDLQERYRLSFWDAMVIQSAACLGCKQLLSEDLNHGQVYGDVQVINPFSEID
ncbi:MAG: PIN domain-containing protein [Chloroflexi bacterium]|nr:MAG: PIN domain-containing protein [Chloroflexota bacterium]